MTRPLLYLVAVCLLPLVAFAAPAQDLPPPSERTVADCLRVAPVSSSEDDEGIRSDLHCVVDVLQSAANSLRYRLTRLDELDIAAGAPAPLPAPDPAPEPEPEPAPLPEPAPVTRADGLPFYFPPTDDLLPPTRTLHVRCDESIAAGKNVLAEGESFPWERYSRGGIEMIYEARDDAGEPCVYPFTPWTPRIGAGANDWPDGSQFIWRSDEPGTQVTFRHDGEWARLAFQPWTVTGRMHVELSDIAIDFPKAVQAMGALHLEAVPKDEGLLTVVIRRSNLTGGKNPLFIPSGRTMVYIEDSEIGANVGTNVDQEHGTYINGILSLHAVDSTWFGQKASGSFGGHQLKNYAYLTILENVTLDNGGGRGAASNRPLYDGSSYGFTWVDGLTLIRRSTEDPRDTLVDLRPAHYHKGRERGRNEADGEVELPWLKVGDWRMPEDDCPTSAVDQVYLHVFRDVDVESFRREPHAVLMQSVYENWPALDADNRAQRAMLWYGDGVDVSPVGFRYLPTNPGPIPSVYACPLPDDAPRLLTDRDAFIRHALAKVGFEL